MVWSVIPFRDGFIVARNGDDGVPEIVDQYYLERQDADETAKLLSEEDD